MRGSVYMFLVIDHGGKHVTGLLTVASHGKNQFQTLHRQTRTPLHRDILHYVITILRFFLWMLQIQLPWPWSRASGIY